MGGFSGFGAQMPSFGQGFSPGGQMMSGAGRFLPDGLSPMAYSGAQFNPSSSLQGFQPNYETFYNPQSMLQAGAPSFQNPAWYLGSEVLPAPAPAPAPAPVQATPMFGPDAQEFFRRIQQLRGLSRGS